MFLFCTVLTQGGLVYLSGSEKRMVIIKTPVMDVRKNKMISCIYLWSLMMSNLSHYDSCLRFPGMFLYLVQPFPHLYFAFSVYLADMLALPRGRNVI